MITRKQARKETAKKLAIGTAVAAATGYLAGILTAPKSGKQARKDIKNVAEKHYSEAEKEFNKLHGDLSKILAGAKSNSKDMSVKAKKEYADLVDKATDAKDKVQQVMSAARKGTAKDKDLQRAVKDASLAVSHLKDFLKK